VRLRTPGTSGLEANRSLRNGRCARPPVHMGRLLGLCLLSSELAISQAIFFHSEDFLSDCCLIVVDKSARCLVHEAARAPRALPVLFSVSGRVTTHQAGVPDSILMTAKAMHLQIYSHQQHGDGERGEVTINGPVARPSWLATAG
jgi:hypothetical protein